MNTFCRHYNDKTCRSCDLIESEYSSQVQSKVRTLERALGPFGDVQLLPPVTSAPSSFRNKAKFSVTGTAANPLIGLLGEGDLDRGQELLHCPLHRPAINEALPAIKEFISLANLTPYSIAARRGELKGLIIMSSEGSEEMYLRFILRSKEALDRVKKHSSFLYGKLPGLVCLSVNIQPVPHALLEGDEEIILSERTSIRHSLGLVSLNLGPRGFVQTNQMVAEKLYETASLWIRDLRIGRFLELFCGQGAFSFFSAPYIRQGLGIEINPHAVEVAKETAFALGLRNLDFEAAPAESVKKKWEEFAPDLVLVNPPRRGLGEAIGLVSSLVPAYLIYSSCSLSSLVDDLEKLKASYTLERAQVFDMFPHTSHFETLVLLKKRATLA